MLENETAEILELTYRLLSSIRERNWQAYAGLCDHNLTCFEPESHGALVEGLDFHRFYFELGGHLGPHQDTVCAPKVSMLGSDAAVVAYVRLVQSADDEGKARTHAFAETRIWQRTGGGWRHVHFHRSTCA